VEYEWALRKRNVDEEGLDCPTGGMCAGLEVRVCLGDFD
jgi:hypothetical protein